MDDNRHDISAKSDTKMIKKREWKVDGKKGFKSDGERAKKDVVVLLKAELWKNLLE